MGHFGFSYVGLTFLLMLTVPNLLWSRRHPEGYDAGHEPTVLVVLERVGQVLVTCTALMFSDYNPQSWSPWTLWLVAAAGLMLLYEGWWVKYFAGRRTLADFCSSFFGVPVAGATLPVVAFFLLGIYGRVIWLMLSVVPLGIGHIGIHLHHRRRMVEGSTLPQ